MKLPTLAVHAGERKKPADYIPVTTPIHGAASYVYENIEDLDRVFAGERPGPMYARYGNPTVQALEEQVAALEGGDLAVATASGMAAIHSGLLTALTDRRKSVVAAKVLYGQTLTLLMKVLEPGGLEVHFADPCDLKALEAEVAAAKPAAVFVETVSNPLLRVSPARPHRGNRPRPRRFADRGRQLHFAGPVCSPLSAGADIVVHSVTKYLAGHGDVLGGILVTREEFQPGPAVSEPQPGADHGPLRGVSDHARRQDAAVAHRAAMPERLPRGRLAESPSAHRTGLLPGRPGPPRPRDGQTPVRQRLRAAAWSASS